jgi:hypothetical protein
MAVHANVRGRNPGMPAFLNVEMAIAAIKAQLAGMELMAVLHGLYGLVAHDIMLGRAPIPSDEHGGAQYPDQGQ